jgi:hypothetical protein
MHIWRLSEFKNMLLFYKIREYIQMTPRASLARTDVSKENVASIFRVESICVLAILLIIYSLID